MAQRNYFASFAAGQQAGRQAQTYQQAQEDRNAFRTLGPQVMAGDLRAYDQLAARSPEVAEQYQAAGDSQARRFKGALDYFDNARKSGNPQAVQAAFKQISPFLSKVTGQRAPEAYDEATMGPAFEQLRARVAMVPADGAGDVVQSQKIGADGFIYNTFRDGRIVNTGVKADRQMWFRDHPGMAPELVDKDGSVMRVGAQGPQAGGPIQVGTGAGAVRFDISDIAPERQQRMAQTVSMMQQAGYPQDEIDAWLSGQLNQPQAAPSFGATAQARPSEAQTAAQVEGAKRGVELQYAPAMAAVEAEAQRQIAEARAEVERNSASATKAADAQDTLSLLDEAEQIIHGSTGSLIGAGADLLAGAFGKSTEGAENISRLQPIAGQLVGKMPRFEGPQSDKDVALYKQMAGDLANPTLPRARRLAALQTIRAMNEQRSGRTAPTSGDAPRSNAVSIPQQAVDYLRANPAMRQMFEQKYGVSADDYLR